MTEATTHEQATTPSEAALVRFSFLYEAAQALATTLNSREVLQQLMNLTMRYFHLDAASVAQVQSDGSLIFQAASGSAARRVLGMRIPPGVGIVGWVAQHGKPLWVPDVRADPRFYEQVDEDTGFVTRSIYAVPVRAGEETLAVVEMVNPDPKMPLEEIEAVMRALASLAAPAIQNAILFEKVSEAEARYQRLFMENIAPLVILDEDGSLLDVNRAATELLGLNEKHIGSPVLRRLQMSEEQFADYRQALKSRDKITWEMRIWRGDHPLHFDIQLTAIGYGGQRTAYQWMAHDITARVELEEMRQQLSRMIVHDLRNPLNNIINSLEFIQASWEESSANLPVDRIISIALRSARRMDNLIQDILDTARLEADEKALLLVEIDLPSLLDEIHESLLPSLTHRRQELTCHLPPSMPPLYADQELLRRVLLNLLDNAIKFTPGGGHISLTVEYDERQFRFIAKDTGRGIDEEDRESIFDMYRRGRFSRPIRGAGIGLAFCKLAIEAHGGRIWLESSGPEGSTFIFTLPRHDRGGQRQ